MWSAEDISFEIVSDMSDDPVVTLLVHTPAGRLRFIGEPVERDGILIARSTHVQDATANAIGSANLMVIAQALMEGMDYDGLIVEGALRTTGANPGRRPRPLRFTRLIRLTSTQGPQCP